MATPEECRKAQDQAAATRKTCARIFEKSSLAPIPILHVLRNIVTSDAIKTASELARVGHRLAL
jgi:hypothetical protein